MHNPPRWQLASALGAVYLIWGSTYLAIRISIETLPPFLMASIRFFVAGIALYAWMRLRGAARPERVHWRSAVMVGGLMLLGGNGGVCWAEQYVPSGLTALIVGTTPLWMVLIDWLWHGAGRPGWRTVIGLLFGFAGIALLISPGEFAGGGHVDSVGAVVLLVATLAWATGSLLSRHAPFPASALLSTGMQMLCGSVLLLLASGLTGEWGRVEWAQVSARSWMALAYLTVLGAIVAYSAYIWVFRVTTTAVASTYAYVNPLVAVFLGWAFASEPVTTRTLLAGAAIIAAVVVIISRRAPRATT